MNRRRWWRGGRLVLFSLVLVMSSLRGTPIVPTGVDAAPGQAGSAGLAPQGFVTAVLTRYGDMTGQHYLVNNPSSTFAQLQSTISLLASGYNPPAAPYPGQYGQYVNPDTGLQWYLPDLLQAASGRQTWLGDDASVGDREEQIKRVLATLSWRLASVPAGTLGLSKEAAGTFSTDPKTACQNTGPINSAATPALDQAITNLLPQVRAATPTLGFSVGTDAAYYSINGKITATIGRSLALLPLPRVAMTGTTLADMFTAGIPVDAARLVMATQNLSGTISMGPLSVTASPTTPTWQPAPADWDFAGTSLGTLPATTPGTSPTHTLPVPLNVLFDSGGLPPTRYHFRAAVHLRVSGLEPPPDWLSHMTSNRSLCPDPGINLFFESSSATEITGMRLIYHEVFPPLKVVSVKLRIGTARFAASDRLKRLVVELRGQAGTLDQQKEAVDRSIPGLRDALDAALARVTQLSNQVAPLATQINQIQSYLTAISSAENALPASMQDLLTARANAVQDLLRLQDDLTIAQQAGDTATANRLLHRIAGQQSAVDLLNRKIAGHDGSVDERTDAYLSRLQALQARLLTLTTQQVQAQSGLANAAETLQEAYNQQVQLDVQLSTLARDLANLDFEVSTVQAFAGGQKVFAAQISGPYQRLQEIDAELTQLKPLLDQAQMRRQALRTDYISAQTLASQALANVASTIEWNSYKKAGIDALDYGYDVAKGWAKGGPVGGLSAALKKGLEGWTAMLLDNSPTGATELNADYTMQLKEATTLAVQKTLDVGKSRLVKDGINKPIKDYANKKLGVRVFKLIYGYIPPDYIEEGASGTLLAPRQGVIGYLKNWFEYADSRQKQLANLEKGVSAPKIGELAGSFVKDLVKSQAKLYLDLKERAAWSDFFQKDVFACSLYPLLGMASEKFWEAHDQYEALEQEKMALLDGYDPNTHTRVLQDDPFDAGTPLSITLSVAGPSSGETVTFGVTVANQTATIAGTYQYAVNTSSLTEAQNPLGLNILVQ